MSDKLVPLTTIDEADAPVEDEALDLAVGGMPKNNFAHDREATDYILQNIYPLLQQIRDDRVALEEEWQEIDRMEDLIHDTNQRYIGRSNVYVPMFNRALTTVTSNLVQGLFPSDEYMDVAPRSPDEAASLAAKDQKAYLQWEFDQVAKVRQKIKPGIRQLAKYGTSPFKYWYDKKPKVEGKLKLEDFLDGTKAVGGMQYEELSCEGFRVSSRSAYHVYVFPSTAADLDEADMVFEDIEVTEDYIKSQERWKNVDKALANGRDTNYDYSEQQRLDVDGLQQPHLIDSKRYVITEIWARMPIPSRYYRQGEKAGKMVMCKILMVGDAIVEVCRNPYAHQTFPYVFGRINVKPGKFYGDGFGRANQAFQYLVNDFMNQLNDCAIYNLNPILKMNPAQIVGPLPKIRPGAVWKMTDLNATGFERPPWEMLQYGTSMVQLAQSMGQDVGGVPPVLQGSKGAKTATASSILQKNAQQPLQHIIEDLELDVMVPLLKACHSLGQQYRPAEIMARVAGKPVKINKASLALDADFIWLASSQAANQMARTQQVLQLMQTVAPLIPLLQQQGYQVDFYPLIQRLYSDGFGFRGFDAFIKKAPQMGPGMMPGMPMPGAMAPGDRVRSPVEQAPGMEGFEPGDEAGDFMDTRMEADALAAGYGDLGGE